MFIFDLKKNKLTLTAIIILTIIFYVNSSAAFAESFDNKLDVDMKLSIGEDGLIKIEDRKSNLTSEKTWNALIKRYKNVIVGFSAVAALTMLMWFIFKFTKLGVYADNPQQRAEVIRGLWVTGIATAFLGSVSLFVYIFYTMLN